MITISAVDKSLSKPARPCTEYNIFFQLERAHILQSQLGSEPCLDGLEAFRPSQPSYAGLPPLPDRYASLVLPHDWHLSGKERRRKRKHRRTHGAIGFHELSNRIAAAWKEADDDIKSYCARVSEVGSARYKLALKEWKRSGGKDQKGAAAIVKDTAKRANKVAAREAPLVQEPSKKEAPEKAAAVSQEDDFDLDALLNHIQFEDEETYDARPAPEIEVRSIWANQDERPLIEQFLSAGPDIIGSINTSPMDKSADDSLGLNFSKEVFERSPSIVSNEPVDMEDDEIISMWNDRDEVNAADGIQHRQEIAPTQPMVAPVAPVSTSVAKDADGCESAFGIKGFDVTMEEVCRLKRILEGQAKVLEGVRRPAVRRRRLSIVACCA